MRLREILMRWKSELTFKPEELSGLEGLRKLHCLAASDNYGS